MPEKSPKPKFADNALINLIENTQNGENHVDEEN
jgi:hypothetical protein